MNTWGRGIPKKRANVSPSFLWNTYLKIDFLEDFVEVLVECFDVVVIDDKVISHGDRAISLFNISISFQSRILASSAVSGRTGRFARR